MKTIITTLAVAILSLTAIGQKVYPLIGAVSMTQPTCHGYSNGEITITPSGGLPPYTYLWSNGDTTQTQSNLVAGNYSVLVNDAVGQTMGGVFVLPEPNQILVQGLTTNTIGHLSNGTIDITNVSNAVGNYTWSWSSNNGVPMNQSQLDQSGLKAGGYKITITDENGCEGVSVFTINKINLPFSFNGLALKQSSGIVGSDEVSDISEVKILDLMGKEVDYEFAPIGYYLVVESGEVIQKIYKGQ